MQTLGELSTQQYSDCRCVHVYKGFVASSKYYKMVKSSESVVLYRHLPSYAVMLMTWIKFCFVYSYDNLQWIWIDFPEENPEAFAMANEWRDLVQVKKLLLLLFFSSFRVFFLLGKSFLALFRCSVFASDSINVVRITSLHPLIHSTTSPSHDIDNHLIHCRSSYHKQQTTKQ